MQRRNLLKLGALSAGVQALGRFPTTQALAPPPITTVLFVSKCHLDVGFTNTQSNVIQLYSERYYPEAIRTAATLRQRGPDRYVWTTGSWLLYQYLEQATSQQRAAMDAAITAGDVAWPEAIFYTIRMPAAEARIDLEVLILGKQPSRMPEALWLTFHPSPGSGSPRWLLEK